MLGRSATRYSSSSLRSSSQFRFSSRNSFSRFSNAQPIVKNNGNLINNKNFNNHINNTLRYSLNNFSTSTKLWEENVDIHEESESMHQNENEQQQQNDSQTDVSKFNLKDINTKDKIFQFIENYAPIGLQKFIMKGIKIVAREEGVKPAFYAFQRMKSAKFPINLDAFNDMMYIAEAYKNPAVMNEILKEMRNSNVSPNLKTYETYLKLIEDDESLNEMLERYSEVPRAQRAALRYYATVKNDRENALKIFEHLKETQETNALTYPMLMAISESKAEFDQYFNIVQENDWTIPEDVWVDIIQNAINKEHFYHVLETSELLETSKPDSLALALRYITFHANLEDPEQMEILESLLGNRDLNLAFRTNIGVDLPKINDLLTAVGNEPDFTRLGDLATYCRKNRNPDYAYKVFENIKAKDGKPARSLLKILFTLANGGRIDAVKEVMEAYPDLINESWEKALDLAKHVKHLKENRTEA